MDLADIVRGHRERAGLSQRELGEVLGLPGTRISEIESGRRHLRFTEAAAIASACGLTDGEWAELRDAALP
ncbi:MAG: helix-turn-helix transcriptional regulator [Alphaproteobacteria bacterium]|nr:helix-turn-helix transcriptional regulator [Alphaproteobacteria bacterium]